jgi:hypothetical protein
MVLDQFTSITLTLADYQPYALDHTTTINTTASTQQRAMQPYVTAIHIAKHSNDSTKKKNRYTSNHTHTHNDTHTHTHSHSHSIDHDTVGSNSGSNISSGSHLRSRPQRLPTIYLALSNYTIYSYTHKYPLHALNNTNTNNTNDTHDHTIHNTNTISSNTIQSSVSKHLIGTHNSIIYGLHYSDDMELTSIPLLFSSSADHTVKVWALDSTMNSNYQHDSNHVNHSHDTTSTTTTTPSITSSLPSLIQHNKHIQTLTGHTSTVLQCTTIRSFLITLDAHGCIYVWSTTGDSSSQNSTHLSIYEKRNDILLHPFFTHYQTIHISDSNNHTDTNLFNAGMSIGIHNNVYATSIERYIKSDIYMLLIGCSNGECRSYTLKYGINSDSTSDHESQSKHQSSNNSDTSTSASSNSTGNTPYRCFVADHTTTPSTLHAPSHALAVTYIHVITSENLTVTLSDDCTARVYDTNSYNQYFRVTNGTHDNNTNDYHTTTTTSSNKLQLSNTRQSAKFQNHSVRPGLPSNPPHPQQRYLSMTYSIRYNEFYLIDSTSLYIYNIYENRLLYTIQLATDKYTQLLDIQLIHNDQQLLVTNKYDGIQVYHIQRQHDSQCVVVQLNSSVTGICSIPSSTMSMLYDSDSTHKHSDQHIVTCSTDQTIKVYNNTTLQCIATYKYTPAINSIHPTSKYSTSCDIDLIALTIIPSTPYIITGYTDGSIRMWNTGNSSSSMNTTDFEVIQYSNDQCINEIQCTINIHDNSHSNVHLQSHPSSSSSSHPILLFISYYSRQITVLDITQYRTHKYRTDCVLENMSDDIISVMLYDIHNNKLYVSAVDGSIYVCDYSTKQRIAKIQQPSIHTDSSIMNHSSPVSQNTSPSLDRPSSITALTVDGILLFTGTDNGSIHVYNTLTYTHLYTFHDTLHHSIASMCTIGSIGLLCVITATGGIICIYNYSTQECLKRVVDVDKRYTKLFYDVNGSKQLFVGCDNGEMLVVDILDIIANTNANSNSINRSHNVSAVKSSSDYAIGIDSISQIVNDLLREAKELEQSDFSNEKLHEEKQQSTE